MLLSLANTAASNTKRSMSKQTSIAQTLAGKKLGLDVIHSKEYVRSAAKVSSPTKNPRNFAQIHVRQVSAIATFKKFQLVPSAVKCSKLRPQKIRNIARTVAPKKL